MPKKLANKQTALYENFIARCSRIERALHHIQETRDLNFILEDMETISEANKRSLKAGIANGRLNEVGHCTRIAKHIYDISTSDNGNQVLDSLVAIKEETETMRLYLIQEMQAAKNGDS